MLHEAAHALLGYNDPDTHIPNEDGNYYDYPFNLLDRLSVGYNFGSIYLPSNNQCLGQ
jgi:hypothetical protein